MWSNIHFGVIGRKINKSDFILLKGAGTEQIISDIIYGDNINIQENFKRLCEFSDNYGDNDGDVEAIKIGFQISEKYDTKTLDNVVNQMLTSLQLYSKTE